MPAYILGALTILICVIAVWASVAEEGEGDTFSLDEYEPEWEPFEQEQEYRKAS